MLKGSQFNFKLAHDMSQTENDKTDESCDERRECKLKLRESDRGLQCDFHENLFCYKCARVSAKSSDALCKGPPGYDIGITYHTLRFIQ